MEDKIDGLMDRWMGGQVWMDKWLEDKMDGLMDKWMS